VDISGKSHVTTGGDLIGGDKTTISMDAQQFEELFARLSKQIQNNRDLSAAERQESIAASRNLQKELKKPRPDLGKIARLKEFLLSKGDRIAAAVGAIFQYPPVQESLKVAAQRLIGT